MGFDGVHSFVKRIFKTFLAGVLVVSFLPLTAFADTSSHEMVPANTAAESESAGNTDSGSEDIVDSEEEVSNAEGNKDEILEPRENGVDNASSANSSQSDGLIDSGYNYASPEFESSILEDESNDINDSAVTSQPRDIDVLAQDKSSRSAGLGSGSYMELPKVSYSTHVQTYGWQDSVNDGATSGTVGEAKRLEGIRISVDGIEGLGVTYRTHVQKIGWQDPVNDGEVSGTSGQALRLEAIQIALTGSNASNYDIYYRVHAQHYGWLDWACNGIAAGTSGYAYRLEAIEIRIQPKGEDAPGSTELPYLNGTYGSGAVNYKTHVQSYGWQDWTWDGGLSGTSGEAKRLEGIRINTEWLDGVGITYRTHVQKIGWQDWVSDGELSGTEGRGLRLEAIQIKLTGTQAEKYDVYYRVHTQKYGWLGWAKNGESAGTSCHAFRLEQIQIVIMPKDQGEPSPSYGMPPSIEAYSTVEGQAMYNVNAWRSQYGVSVVTGNSLLHECAQIRSQELTILFDHTRPNGEDCFTVCDEVGCDLPVYGENIAYGFSDGFSVVNAWMNSPGHRANILNESCRYIAVGETGFYWAQMLSSEW